jgi:hypothetical protein
VPVGYPDYERLGRSGQYQIFYGQNAAPAIAVPFFRGYVGSWPFINSFQNMAASADFAQLTFAWFPDNTFINDIGFRIANRTGNNLAYAQYANLSDWLAVYYHTISGNPMTFSAMSLYGTQQPSEPRQLASQDTGIWEVNTTIAAATTVSYALTKVIPGVATLNLWSGAVSWNVNFQYYDYGLNAYQTLYQADQNAFADAAAHIQVPTLDTPMIIQIHNQDAAPRPFNAIMAVMT